MTAAKRKSFVIMIHTEFADISIKYHGVKLEANNLISRLTEYYEIGANATATIKAFEVRK